MISEIVTPIPTLNPCGALVVTIASPVTLSYWKLEILTEGADKLTSNLSAFSSTDDAMIPVY